MSPRFIIRKANPTGNPPKAPEAANPAKASEGKAPSTGGAKQLKWGQKARHVDKTRYPKRPDNALGETSATWVIPADQRPMYGGKAEAPSKEETKDTAKPKQETTGAVAPKQVATASEPTTVKEAPSSSTTPKVAEQSLLGGKDAPAPKVSVPKDKAPKEKDPFTKEEASKIHEKLKKEAETRLANKDKAEAKQQTIDLSSMDPKVVAAAEKKKKLDEAEAKRKATKPSNASEIARHQIHTSIAKEASDKAWKLLDDPSLSVEDKVKVATINEALIEHAKQEHAPNSAENKDLQSLHKVIVRMQKDREPKSQDIPVAKEPSEPSKEAPDAAATKEFSTKISHEKHVSTAKEAVDKTWALIDHPSTSNEDKRRLADINESLMEHARSEQPPTPEQAKDLKEKVKVIEELHKTTSDSTAKKDKHVASAQEAVDKVWDIIDSPASNAEEKKKLTELNESLMEHAKTGEPPTPEQEKDLAEKIKLVESLHKPAVTATKDAEKQKQKASKDAAKQQQKDAKQQQKDAKQKQKDAAKQQKLVISNEKKAKKEEEKQQKQATREATQEARSAYNEDPETEVTSSRRSVREQSLMGAFHSGRAAGAAAVDAAASNTGSGLGKQVLAIPVTGAATIGHGLLTDKDRTYYQETAVKQPKDSLDADIQARLAELTGNKETLKDFNKSFTSSMELVKSFTASIASVSRDTLPPAAKEFLVNHCNFDYTDVITGKIKLKGALEAEYHTWLCNRAVTIAKGLL